MMEKILILIFVAAGLVFDAGAKGLQHKAAHTSGPAVSVSPEKALKKLIQGNHRFVVHRMLHPDMTIQRRVSLARNGQRPFAIILSCSDSRVPPEIVFDEGLGNLFVVRVAGNIADDAMIGSIEYAVEHLGAQLLMVLGHEKCGAVQAAIANQREAHLASLVDAIRPAVDKVREKDGDQSAHFIEDVIHENVSRVVSQLKSSEPVLSKLVSERKLQIVGGYYHLASGQVEVAR